MNPYPEDVSVDVQLQVIGRSSPTDIERFQGITLFANSVQQIPIHTAPGFESREHIAVIVKSRQGRIVAERLQTIDEQLFAASQALEADLAAADEETADEEEAADGEVEEETSTSGGASGASLQLGSAQAQTNWFFTSGRVNPDTTHLLTVYNPAALDIETVDENTAEILVDIWPSDTAIKETIYIPIEREILPGSLSVIDLVSEAQRLGFILPIDFSVEVISSNALPVIAERWQFGQKVEDAFDFQDEIAIAEQTPQVGDGGDLIPLTQFDAATPDSMSTGLMTSGGVAFAPVENWVLPDLETPSDTSTWITVYAPTAGTTVTVSDTLGSAPLTIAGVDNPVRTELGNERLFFKVPASTVGRDAALAVSASAPVYVEAQIISASQANTIPGVPVGVE